MQEMTWPEIADRLARDVVIVPAGSMEQHGPHLPLGVDVLIPAGLASRVAQAAGSCLVAPAIPYGCRSQPSSGGGSQFPGTTSVDGVTFVLLVRDLLRDWMRQGVRRFLLLNGHHENTPFLTEAVEVVLRDHDRPGDAKLVIANWWDLISEETKNICFREVGFPGWDTEHAALTETALMRVFAPQLVRDAAVRDDQAERKLSYQVFPPPRNIIPSSGVLYKATAGTQERGRLIADQVVALLAGIVQQELLVGGSMTYAMDRNRPLDAKVDQTPHS